MTQDTLTLPGDFTPVAPLLHEVLATGPLADLIMAIAAAAVPLARRLALGALPGDPAAHLGTNDSGDGQKALDVAAHDYLIAALRKVSLHSVVSEEAAEAITCP